MYSQLGNLRLSIIFIGQMSQFWLTGFFIVGMIYKIIRTELEAAENYGGLFSNNFFQIICCIINNPLSHMNWYRLWIVLGLVLTLGFCGQISSWDTKISYGYDGRPLSYNLFFNLDSGLGATDYLRIVWPQTLHSGSDKTKVLVTLISNENNYQITSVSCSSVVADTNPIYFVSFKTQLTAGKWYQIQVYPNKANTLSSGLIQMESVSDTGTDYISYDQNFAFGYYYVHPVSLTSTLGVSVSSTSSSKNRASQIYTIDIEITPTVSNSNGGNFTAYLYNDGTGTSLLDFSFVGICQSAVPLSCPSCAAAILNYCTISTDLSTITFSTSTVTASTPIRITTQVQNPSYVATRGIKVFWVDLISGFVVENGLQASSLTVAAITINSPGANRVQLLWGIQKGYTDATGYVTDVVFGIYKAAASSLVGPLNSFNNGFTISDTPPINSVFTVQMNIGALGVLQGSIVHNLPAASGQTVYCSYTSPNIICQNVGAFINTNYRYFISGKAYFSNSLSSTLSLFGDVKIISVVKDSIGNTISGVKLFNDLVTGQTIPVTANVEFLDTSGGGWHASTNALGYTRIVSYNDDLTLSSTANAIKGFYTGTNSTVGIVPNLSGSQQLLFLLKVPSGSMYSGSSNNSFVMKILYNNQVIDFETGASGLGLDFVGYNASTSSWSISSTPCYTDSAIMCQKYNNDGNNTRNFQSTVNNTNGTYGIYIFSCGENVNSTSYCSGTCSDECQILKGYSATTQYGGVVSMRRVVFPTGYHSSLYADQNLLDFVISFYHGSTMMSATLINAYTIEAVKMANIKYSYVNYYDNSSIYNKGVRIPTLARIAGGVLPTESLGATVVAVFFDENMDGTTFMTSPTTNFDIGCSTGQCVYYPNSGVLVPRDIWHCSDRVEFYNLPSIQNEFNLLVPITQKLGNPPKSLTIAFLAQNNTVNNVTGLLRVLSVYRLFGPVVTGTVKGTTIGTLNGLTSSFSGTQLTNIDFTSMSWTATGSFSYNINGSNIYDNPPNNTFLIGSNTVASGATYGNGSYGAGVTITSFNYNIFASAIVKFNSPPNNTASTCSIFSYVYNEIENVANNVERSGKYVYIAFCPIDDNFSMTTTGANIVFNYPQYPNAFVSGFPLTTVLAYGYSSKIGLLQAYNLETSSLTFSRTCSTIKNELYSPSSTKQRASFTVNFSSITMGPVPKGYPVIKLTLRIPQTTVPSAAALSISSSCDVSLSYLTCSVSMTNYTFYTITLTLTGTKTYSVQSVTVSLYADSSASFGSADLYTMTMYLPQSTSATPLMFGSDFNIQSTLCSCTSSFIVALTPFGSVMNLNNFTYESSGKSLRGKFGFNFGASSFRDYFFTTSYFEFNLGFLSTPNIDWKNKANFRCVVYNNGSSSVNTLWKSITLSSMPTIRLTPKAQISNPNSLLFNLVCFGGGMPNGTSSSSLTGNWYDSAVSLQSATPISSSSVTFTSTSTSFTPTLSTKRFNTDGAMAFYQFLVVPSAALDQNSRIYVEFPYPIPASINREKYLECYTRISNTNIDDDATYTYCALIGERRIIVWNNRIISAGGNLYIDIFGVSQPKGSNITVGQSLISISIDTDTDYGNGVSQYGQVSEVAPTGAPANVITITAQSMSSYYIRTQQDISITFQFATTGKLTAGKKVYIVLPASYAIWNKRGDNVTSANCILNLSGGSTNLATACKFISLRVLAITTSADAGKTYVLTLKGIMSSPYLPEELANSIRFYVYLASNDETSITDYSYQDKSSALSLIRNKNLIDLSWISYNASQSGSSLGLTKVSSGTVEVYIGYFSKLTEIRQQIYPSNFKSSLAFTIKNQPVTDFPILPSNSINLGYTSQFFRIAASSNVATGLYNLQFTKTGDSLGYYTQFPPLTLIVQNTKCSLSTKQASYTVPLGGYTLPIIISAFNCIPINGINITYTSTSAELSLVAELSNTELTQSDQDGQIYMVFKHTQTTLVAGNTITISFTVAGTDAASYGTIPNIILTLVAQSIITKPLATALTSPTLGLGTASFNLQCSVASTIYWGLGIYPSILNIGALGFQARIISGGTGLQTNFTESMDFYWEVYGVEYVSIANSQISKTVYGLKSNSNYLFKYFCVNQLSQISDGQLISFTSTDNGAYLMKILMTFTGKITYGQFNDLACSLAENFVIPYQRVYTQAISYCGNTSTIFYANSSSMMLDAANSNNQYIYNFYVNPDYTLQQDLTNLNIRQFLSQQTFSTQIITSTANFIDLPTLVQMQTEDVQNLGGPTYSIKSVVAGLNSVMINASITNMNGFVVVAVMNGEFTSNMSLPTTQNLKQGLFQVNTSLKSVQIQYMPQNYNVTFLFSNLTPNTTYWMFHFATVDDPTLTALSTEVTSLSVTTLADSNIQVMSSVRLFATILVVLFLMLN